jgi:GT2 family glycosyltransferase
MPAVSVIVPAYDSHATIPGTLDAIASQTFRDFETIVVDSGPDDTAARLIGERFPWVRFERSGRRLLPHAARNRGVELAQGELLVFTDPDIYPYADWLERLVTAHRETDAVIVGALACHGERWLDQGIHICKFSKWLPGGRVRLLDVSPTANMLISRRDFMAAGGLPGEEMLGDVTLSWSLRDGGRELRFEPAAVGEHHHVQTLREFLRERYQRGKMFGRLRAGRRGHGRGVLFLYLTVSVLPVRLSRILALVAAQAWRARQTLLYLATLPLVVLGHAASLAGEAVVYAQRLWL